MTLIVACVYTPSENYPPSTVTAMRDAVRRWLPVPHEFVCLTNHLKDMPEDIDFKLGYPDWPGWWFKMALWRPGNWCADDTILYIDLDNVILGDLTPMAKLAATVWPGELIAVQDWKLNGYFNSSVMAWKGNSLSLLYEEFSSDPEFYMRQFAQWPLATDQGFIQSRLQVRGLGWRTFNQELHPEFFISKEAFTTLECDRDARMVIWSWLPKPWQMENVGERLREWQQDDMLDEVLLCKAFGSA